MINIKMLMSTRYCVTHVSKTRRHFCVLTPRRHKKEIRTVSDFIFIHSFIRSFNRQPGRRRRRVEGWRKWRGREEGDGGKRWKKGGRERRMRTGGEWSWRLGEREEKGEEKRKWGEEEGKDWNDKQEEGVKMEKEENGVKVEQKQTKSRQKVRRRF